MSPAPQPGRTARGGRTPRPAAPLTTARLCAAAPATRGMLRLYEREGLISPPQRSDAGYRQDAHDTVDRVRAIRLLPMAMLSVVLGTSFIVLRHFIGDGPQDSMTGTIAAFVLNLFLIPKL